MNNLKKDFQIKQLLLLILMPLLVIGCAPIQPRNAYKPLADTMGVDKVMKCAANAQYFKAKGENENTDFGSKYVKPYSTQKWLTAKLMYQFYYNASENFPETDRQRLYNSYNNNTYFTKEIADECQKGFDSAPDNLRNIAYNDAPFFSDQQKISFVCQSNSITNAEDAIIYYRNGNPQRAFGICVGKSETKRIREFLVIYDSSRVRGRFVGSYRINGQLVFAPISQVDDYYKVSYFPDLKK